MLTFLSDKYLRMLQDNRLDTFDKVWNYQVNWFEEPNERRGGWSGVGRIKIADENGVPMNAFLKRQDNHLHKSWLHPIKGQPTFEREFLMMRYLERHNVGVPEVMLFRRDPAGSFKTTLLTRELSGFVPLEEFTANLFSAKRPSLQQQKLILAAVALFAKKLHSVKVQHRSFYPKHLFIDASEMSAPKVAAVDLEKSRINHFALLRTLMDLSALNRHAEFWSRSRRLYFYLQYMSIPRLTPYTKWLCKRIVKRSQRGKRS